MSEGGLRMVLGFSVRVSTGPGCNGIARCIEMGGDEGGWGRCVKRREEVRGGEGVSHPTIILEQELTITNTTHLKAPVDWSVYLSTASS